MFLHRFCATTIALMLPASLYGQAPQPRAEAVGSAVFVVGSTSLRSPVVSGMAEHGGLRLDGGVQVGNWSAGLGGRIWLAGIRDSLNADGADGFVAVSRRIGPGRRTALRGTAGVSFNEFVFRRDQQLPNEDFAGPSVSFGIEHEVPAFARTLLFSLDVVLPPGSAGPVGRRSPVLEFGLGGRGRGLPSLASIFGF